MKKAYAIVIAVVSGVFFITGTGMYLIVKHSSPARTDESKEVELKEK